MDALVIHAPGDLRVEAFPTPAVETGQVRVRVRAGGICGSDLHYCQHGGFGTIRIRQPMVLGHEVAGIIEEIRTLSTYVLLVETEQLEAFHERGIDVRFHQAG